MSSDHRRQSLQLASKRRRSSIQLERRGTIRRDSRIPHLDTPTDGILGRKRDVIIGTETDSAHPESDSLTEQKKDKLASVGAESQTEQPSDSVTDQGDTTVKTEQGPPAVRRNTLFPDQVSTNDAQRQEKADGRKRDVIGTETDSAHPESDSLAEQKEDKLAFVGAESQTEQPSDSLTDQGDTTVTTEQGPPAVRRNTLFPDQEDSTNDAQTQEKADDESRPKELQQNKEVGDDRGSKEPQSIKNDEVQAQGKTDDNSLQPHTDRGCSHLPNEVKNISQRRGVISSENQIKEQVTIMAQNAIDSKYFILMIFVRS